VLVGLDVADFPKSVFIGRRPFKTPETVAKFFGYFSRRVDAFFLFLNHPRTKFEKNREGFEIKTGGPR